MQWLEINIITNKEEKDNILQNLILNDILEIQIIDKQEDAIFLKENVNKVNYADYVEDELLFPNTNEIIIKIYLNFSDLSKIEHIKSLQNNINIQINKVNSEDWENKWKEHYKPIEIGHDIVVVPSWEKYYGSRKNFTIEPGHLFGTGLHQSTQQTIEEVEKYAKNTNMLDIGCGTGILAIISLICGAKEATAIDIEESAIDIVTKNADLNNVNVNLLVGNILENENLRSKLLEKKYSLITANIVADVIISMLLFIKQAISKNGVFICAGIIKEREKDVIIKLSQNNFKIININYKDNWVCITSSLNNTFFREDYRNK
ncbi:MAG: 50S ribosomal protein L11 methyltransferase [Defluviitaleaceae bacterium]|nr:50S ribosomal protein L11 methyltransferase [Defluviitaleaceae bacterium]